MSSTLLNTGKNTIRLMFVCIILRLSTAVFLKLGNSQLLQKSFDFESQAEDKVKKKKKGSHRQPSPLYERCSTAHPPFGTHPKYIKQICVDH